MLKFSGTLLAALVAIGAANAWVREAVTSIGHENRPARADRAQLTGERARRAIVAAIQKNS